LPEEVVTRIRVFDVRGRLVDVAWDGLLPAGRARIPWSGRDSSGTEAPTGVYFVLTEIGPQTFKGKLLLLR
jgi:hypothetical protein